MNPKAPPFFGWYWADYAADTPHLSCEQHGAYRLLIDAAWQRGCELPDDDAFLAGICKLPLDRWLEHRPVIVRFFRVDDGIWAHKRVSEEWAKTEKRMEDARHRGVLGAEARYSKRAKLTVLSLLALWSVYRASIDRAWSVDSPSIAIEKEIETP